MHVKILIPGQQGVTSELKDVDRSFGIQNFLKIGLYATIMSGLFENLPLDLLINCFARVPFCSFPDLHHVCPSWRVAVQRLNVNDRNIAGTAEEFVCIFTENPSHLWEFYDPRRDLWLTQPALPTPKMDLAHFGAVSTGGKIYVLGGGSCTNHPVYGIHGRACARNAVWSYSPFLRKWAELAPMLVPRASFGCAVIDGKIIVAGGFAYCGIPIATAERYDPKKDEWVSLPDLKQTHNSACLEVVVGGKLYIVHKGKEEVQLWEEGEKMWKVLLHPFFTGLADSIAVIRDEIYVLMLGRLLHMKFNRGGTEKLMTMEIPSREGHSLYFYRNDSALIGLGDDLHVIGGRSWFLLPLADVDVLTFPHNFCDDEGCQIIRRQAAPMPWCSGSILNHTVLRI
ncbi:hypothetical protein HHK36_033487 [Tetracentron sinense]|uniref:F-box domain-containing protein n=1 Tax=Tetracentron sinense TaxID=13715 RepID=A0A835CW24_TETSI|nr:hypothetical protein HHK36_033487 [Tetracentron sinense]